MVDKAWIDDCKERMRADAEKEGCSVELLGLMRSCGYAPGDYVGKCHNCGQRRHGDK